LKVARNGSCLSKRPSDKVTQPALSAGRLPEVFRAVGRLPQREDLVAVHLRDHSEMLIGKVDDNDHVCNTSRSCFACSRDLLGLCNHPIRRVSVLANLRENRE
jgi:hypothetical protein